MRWRRPERLDDVLLDRLLIKCGEHLSLFAAPATARPRLRNRRRTPMRAVDRSGAPHHSLRDRGPAACLDALVAQTLLAADEIVIVATPDLASLRNTKNMLDWSRARRPNDTPPRLVINQVGMPKRPEIPIKEFADGRGPGARARASPSIRSSSARPPTTAR